jgi:mannose-6-phosphate isomerase-like protein (cupin superfamily)
MVPFDRQEVMVVRQRQIGVDTAFEPPLRVGFGISDQTVDIAHAVMGRTVLPPGGEPNQTHYHANNDVCWYIMSGSVRCISARSDLSHRREIILEAGDFRLHPERRDPCHRQRVADRRGLAGVLLCRCAERRGVGVRLVQKGARRLRKAAPVGQDESA